MMTFGEKLKYYRKEAGLTQENISQIIGIKRSAYAYYEIDKSFPKLPVLSDIAAIYRITIDELVDLNDRKEVSQSEDSEEGAVVEILNELTPYEKTLVLKTRIMSRDDKQKLLDFINNL